MRRAAAFAPLVDCTSPQRHRAAGFDGLGGVGLGAPAPTPAGMGYAPFDVWTIPRPGLKDVVGWMQKFAHQDKIGPVRSLVEHIVSGLEPGLYAHESLEFYYWVLQNIRYLQDPFDVEFLKTPSRLLSEPAGDCDDMSTLIASMLLSAGHRAAFNLASFNGNPVPSHVFAMVLTPRGWVPLDPVANRETAQMMRSMTGSILIEV